MIRHVVLSGSFREAGVKKLATAFSEHAVSDDFISYVLCRRREETHL